MRYIDISNLLFSRFTLIFKPAHFKKILMPKSYNNKDAKLDEVPENTTSKITSQS